MNMKEKDLIKVMHELENYKYMCRYRGDCGTCESCDTVIPVAINALQKQIPMKPVYSDYDDNGFDEIIPNEARCPICEHEFEFGTWNEWDTPYCVCGQKMDWSK